MTSQNYFLSLPLEMRLNIYRYALSTAGDDETTATETYAIKERRPFRSTFKGRRENNYTLLNCTKYSAALRQTCSQISGELKVYLPRPTFKFTSEDAFYSFLSWDTNGKTDKRDWNVLKLAAEVVVVVKEDHSRRDDLIRFSNLMEEPLTVKFVADIGGDERKLAKAKAIWAVFLDSF